MHTAKEGISVQGALRVHTFVIRKDLSNVKNQVLQSQRCHKRHSKIFGSMNGGRRIFRLDIMKWKE